MDFQAMKVKAATKRAAPPAPVQQVPAVEAPAQEAPAAAPLAIPEVPPVELSVWGDPSILGDVEGSDIAAGVAIPGVEDLSAVDGWPRLQCVDPVPGTGTRIGIRIDPDRPSEIPPGWRVLDCNTNSKDYKAALLPDDALVWVMARRRAWASPQDPETGEVLQKSILVPWSQYQEGCKARIQLAVLVCWGLGDQGMASAHAVISLSGAGASRGSNAMLTISSRAVEVQGRKLRGIRPMAIAAARSIPNPHGGAASWLVSPVSKDLPVAWCLRAGTIIHDWLANGGGDWARKWDRFERQTESGEEELPF